MSVTIRIITGVSKPVVANFQELQPMCRVQLAPKGLGDLPKKEVFV